MQPLGDNEYCHQNKCKYDVPVYHLAHQSYVKSHPYPHSSQSSHLESEKDNEQINLNENVSLIKTKQKYENSARLTNESTPANQSKIMSAHYETPRNQRKSARKLTLDSAKKVTKQPKNSDSEEYKLNECDTSKDLSQRKDVVYKSLIRSLKRYITEKWDLTIDKSWFKKDKEHAYFGQIDNLFNLYYQHMKKNGSNRPVHEIVEDRDFMRNDSSIKLNPENLKIYLWMIVIPDIVKPYLKNQTRRLSSKLLYDCLYKYSHKKRDKILAWEFFQFLFKDYVESGGFKIMLEKDDTLNKNADIYQEACDYFISRITSFK